jgi:hypothetical protein
LHFGNTKTDSLGDTINFETQTLDAIAGRRNDFREFGRQMHGLHNLHVMLLERGEGLWIRSNQNEVVDVDEVTGAIETKVGRVGDAVEGGEMGLGIKKMLVD